MFRALTTANRLSAAPAMSGSEREEFGAQEKVREGETDSGVLEAQALPSALCLEHAGLSVGIWYLPVTEHSRQPMKSETE